MRSQSASGQAADLHEQQRRGSEAADAVLQGETCVSSGSSWHPCHVGKVFWVQVSPASILVVYDDLDLPTAAVRLRAKGGHGGHNGMRSIMQHLGGCKELPRLRIGALCHRRKRLEFYLIAKHLQG